MKELLAEKDQLVERVTALEVKICEKNVKLNLFLTEKYSR